MGIGVFMADNTTKSATTNELENIRIQHLFKLMVDSGASDLHLTSGSPPAIRVNGDIVRVKLPALTPSDTKRLVYQILTEEQKNEFEKNLELDLSFGNKKYYTESALIL